MERQKPARPEANHYNLCARVDASLLPVEDAHDVTHCDVVGVGDLDLDARATRGRVVKPEPIKDKTRNHPTS